MVYSSVGFFPLSPLHQLIAFDAHRVVPLCELIARRPYSNRETEISSCYSALQAVLVVLYFLRRHHRWSYHLLLALYA